MDAKYLWHSIISHGYVNNKREKCFQSLAVCKIVKVRYTWSYLHFVYVPKVSWAPSSFRNTRNMREYLVFTFDDDTVVENVGFLAYAATNSTQYFRCRCRMVKWNEESFYLSNVGTQHYTCYSITLLEKIIPSRWIERRSCAPSPIIDMNNFYPSSKG